MNLLIRTSRLTLTPFTDDDIDLTIEMFADPKVNYTGSVMSEEEVRKCLPEWVQRGGNGCIGIWCISSSETYEKLGTLALLPMPIETENTDFGLLQAGQEPKADIEIGYYLKQSAWGNGYATEASKALIQRVFESSSLSEIVATFDPNNKASRNVLIKCGFVDHGQRPSYGTTGPDFRITRNDWLRAQEHA